MTRGKSRKNNYIKFTRPESVKNSHCNISFRSRCSGILFFSSTAEEIINVRALFEWRIRDGAGKNYYQRINNNEVMLLNILWKTMHFFYKGFPFRSIWVWKVGFAPAGALIELGIIFFLLSFLLIFFPPVNSCPQYLRCGVNAWINLFEFIIRVRANLLHCSSKRSE